MKKKNYLPLVWFVLGFGVFMSTRVSRLIPHWDAAIVVAPIFILAFARSLPAKKANWLTLLGFLLSLNIALWGLFELDDPTFTMLFNIVRSSIIALLFSIPYMADRALYPKLSKNRILSTLSFPVAQTAMIFLLSLEGPFDGDTLSAVYGGFGNLVIKQIASLTGLFGFVFVYSWLASALNYAGEKRFNWAQIKPVTLTFVSVALVILVFGTIKTSVLNDSKSDTVKVAAVFLMPDEGEEFIGQDLFSDELSPYEKTMSQIEALTKEAVSNGAKLVTFQEAAIRIHENDETKLIKDLTDLAEENYVYFSLAYGVLPDEGKGRNMAILISNRGAMEINYQKRFLMGMGDMGGESTIYEKGAEVIQSAETPYGRIGIATCRDMAFPKYARQAGEQQVDILFNPSYDYPKSTGAMYSLRAIENGFSMVRPVYNGYSYAVDYNGKLLASMDSDLTDTGIMYAEVPTRGVNTLYSNVGDLLGWICVVGFLGFLPLNFILRRIKNKEAQKE